LLNLKLPNREKVKTKPDLPPYFHEVDVERQGGMTEVAANSIDLQKRIQKIWIPLFNPPPPLKKEKQLKKLKQISAKLLKIF
jgi:hypothetical protein